MPKKDLNHLAKFIVDQATSEEPRPEPTIAQESGRKGGLKGGKARDAALTPERKAEIAKKAAEARWKKS
jgi:hypothetical protein